MTAGLAVIWHGTQQDSFDLLNAIAPNCECLYVLGIRTSTCPPHEMLAKDQRALDGLLFARRLAPQLVMEEMTA